MPAKGNKIASMDLCNGSLWLLEFTSEHEGGSVLILLRSNFRVLPDIFV